MGLAGAAQCVRLTQRPAAGSPSSLHHITERLREVHGTTVLVHAAEANWGTLSSFWSTTDGVAPGGTRLADEITGLLAAHPRIHTLSLVSLSLGGLYSRYALAVLQERGALDRLTLQNFITLASPHTGVRGHLNGLYYVRTPLFRARAPLRWPADV